MSTNPIQNFFSLFLAEGIFLIVLGILIIILPQYTTFALAILLSCGLILLGIYRLINSIITRKEIIHPILNRWLKIITSILMIVIGIYLTMNPFFNVLFLTMGIGVYFILEGVNSFMIAIHHRDTLKYWWFTLFFSLIQFLLAFIIIFGLPFTALWTIGLLIGINLVFSGISLISIYSGTKSVLKTK